MRHRSHHWKEALAAVGDLTALLCRGVSLATHRTSFRFDPLTWKALQEIAARESVTVHELCSAIHKVKPRGVSFTAAIRVAVLRYYMDAATETEHGGRLN
jgi:predicted DNA-binding ribbon-helix-helix protein